MADITGMQPAGKILPIWRGDYNNSTYYEQTDIVLYNNSSYIAKQDIIGNPPPEPVDNANDYWQLVAKGIVDADISDATVEFEEAQTLQNIQSGEETKTLFGKIKKWFAHLNDTICRDNNDTKVTRIRADEGVQVSNRANDRHIPVYASDFVTVAGGSTGRSLANLSLKDLSNNNHIDVLTNISQITGIGFWAIESIDNAYATSIGIDNNTGDFYALVLDYNGNGIDFFNFGTIILTTPRINSFHYEIQIWEGRASAVKTLNNRSVLNTIEEISANTESRSVAGALAAKTMMADYNAKINQINSNLANKIGLKLKTETLTCSAGIIRNYTFPNLPTHNFSFPIISSCSLNYEGVAVGRNVIEDGSIWVYSPVSQDIIVYLVVFT